MRITLAVLLFLVAGCRTSSPGRPGNAFWDAVRPLCGQAFEGRMTEGTEPTDADMGSQRLVMHVQSCSDSELRIPFHVGANRSRTWVVTRSADGVRLKHDHRHEDGSADRVTQYGGDTVAGDDDLELDFFADSWTASLLPAARTNIWTLAVDPGRTFVYALRREEQGRRFRVEFDLTRPVTAPPPPW